MLTSRTEQVPNVQVASASARLVRYCQTKRLELQVPAPEPSVDRGESGEVALPLYSRYIQVLGCLTFGIQHIARRWSGLDTAVEDGRGKIKKEVASKK